MKNKIIGSTIIAVTFILIQLFFYYGTYLNTGSWSETFAIRNSGIIQIVINNIWLIIGTYIIYINLHDTKKH